MVSTELNQNTKEIQTFEGQTKSRCNKQIDNTNCSEECEPAKSRNCKQDGRRSRKKCFYKLSIISVVIGLSNVSLGTAIFIEGMKLPYWATKSAFGIWFGFCVFCTGVLGISYVLSKSKKKVKLFVYLNFVTMALTLVSFGCYAGAVVHYHNIRTGGINVECRNTTLIEDRDNCRNRQRSKATLLAVLNGFLLVLSLVQSLVCLLLIMYCSVARNCCKKLFIGNDDNCQSQYAMYPGCPYGPTSLDFMRGDYHLDPTPLKPQVSHKFSKVPVKTYTPSHSHGRRSLTRKPQFKTMESITESIESAETLESGHETVAPET